MNTPVYSLLRRSAARPAPACAGLILGNDSLVATARAVGGQGLSQGGHPHD